MDINKAKTTFYELKNACIDAIVNFFKKRNISELPFKKWRFSNTPVIIKYPFWQMTAKNLKAVYVCINQGQAFCPEEIKRQSVCIDADIAEVLKKL